VHLQLLITVRHIRFIRCDTQMASSVKPKLLNDGVVDTLVSVRAASGAHASVSIKASNSANPLAQLFEDLVNERV
jgi:hypothetical protein